MRKKNTLSFFKKFSVYFLAAVFLIQFLSYSAYGFRYDFLGNGGKNTNEAVEGDMLGSRATDKNENKEKQIKKDLSKIGIPFTKNEGQIQNSQVEFYANIFSGYAFVQDDGLTYNIIIREEPDKSALKPIDITAYERDESQEGPRENPLVSSRKGYVFNEKFVDGNVNVRVKGGKKSKIKLKYFGKGNSNSTESISYDSLQYQGVWNKIDVQLVANGDNIEKLFYIDPNGNVDDIRMKVNDPDRIYVADDGSLVLETELGYISMTPPFAYQTGKSGAKEKIRVEYKVIGSNEYGFSVGEYDKSRTLVIDPLLAGTSFGIADYMEVNAVATDPFDNIYAVGYVYEPWFPTTLGACYTVMGSANGFISKFSSDMTTLLASTFFGGDYAELYDILIASGTGNVVVAGTAEDVITTTAGADSEAFNGIRDGFISVLDSDLSTLLYSTYVGGSSYEYLHSVEEDSSGNLFVTGTTYSANFPSTAGAFQEVHGGGTRDVFLSKYSADLSDLLASTFYGGVSSDKGYSLAIDGSDNVFVFGEGGSASTTSGAYMESNCASGDLFVAKFTNNLSTLSAGTYICGSGYEDPYEILVDDSDNVVIGASIGADGTDYPTTAGAYNRTHDGGYEFIISILSNDLTELVASTFLGGGGNEWYAMGHDVYHNMAIDNDGSIFFSNITDSCLTFPTTAGAFMEIPLSSEVGYYGCTAFEPVIIKLSSDLSTLEAATFYGGSEYSQGAALTLDNGGNVILGGTAYDANYFYYDDIYPYYFPHTDDAYSTNFYAEYAGYLGKLDNDLSAQTLDHFTVRTDVVLDTENFDSELFPPTYFSVGGDAPFEQFRSVQDGEFYIDKYIYGANDEYNPSPATVFINTLVGYHFYIDSTGQSLSYSKTSDGGSTWGAAVTIDTVVPGWTNVAAWYDRWTPGDNTGTLVHIAAVDDSTDDVYYTYLDTSDDTIAAITVALSGTTYTEASNGVPSITKSAEGNLFVSCNFSNYTGSAGGAVAKSINGGTAWTPYNTGWSTVAADQVQLLPLLNDNDMIAIRADTANDEIGYQIYDEVGDAWAGSWTSIAPLVDDASYDQWFSATLNKATGDIYLTFASYTSSTTNDIEFWTFDDTARSWTQGTDVFTDDSSVLFPSATYDNTGGDIYLAYARGNLVYGSTHSGLNVYYKVSSDGGNTWSAESYRLNNYAQNIWGIRTNIAAEHRPYAIWYLYSSSMSGETLSTSTTKSAAKSGNISYGETSYIEATYNFPNEGKIAFNWIADPGDWGDAIIFCADNSANCNFYQADYAMYEDEDYEVVMDVGSGSHDFRWEYIKATAVSEYGDEGWIDNVRFISASSSKTVASGATTTIEIKMYDNSGLWEMYYGEKTVTLSGATTGGGTPTCVDKYGTPTPFGTPTILDFKKGRATCDMNLYTAEVASIDVDNGSIDSIASAAYDLDMTITGGAPPVLSAANTSISVSSSTVEAGTDIDITVTSYDTLGNPYVTGGETVVIAVAGGNNVSPIVTDNSNGTYTASYTAANAGIDVVTATIAGNPVGSDMDGTSDGSYNITVNAPLANVPNNLSGTAGEININLGWGSNSNPAGTEYYAENTTAVTNSGWITSLIWDSTGLACGNSYNFRVKARNADLVQTAFSTVSAINTSACPTPGGGGIILPDYPDEPAGGFKVIINKDGEFTDRRKVKLDFVAGEDVKKMSISNKPDFSESIIEDIRQDKEWDLCGSAAECSSGTKTVYAKFYNYNGFASQIVSDSIEFDGTVVTVEINKHNGKTKYREIPIGISGGDEEGGVMVSDNPDFCGANEIPYTDHIDYDLCGGKHNCEAGKKNVYVKVYNKWGISIGLSSAEIEYEGDTPGLNLLINQGGVNTKRPYVKLDLEVNDETDMVEFSNYYDFSKSWTTTPPIAGVDWDMCYQLDYCMSGEKIIYVKSFNNKGELVGNSSRSIRFENTEDGLELVIEKGTKNVKTERVLLSLKAKPEVKTVKISNSPDFCGADEIEVDPDQDETEVVWDLCQGEDSCESGDKEVYIEYYNEDGGLIGGSSDDVYYEAPGEELNIVINNGDGKTGDNTVEAKITYDDTIETMIVSDPNIQGNSREFSTDELDGTQDGDNTFAVIDWDLCGGEPNCETGEKEVRVEFINSNGETVGTDYDNIYYVNPVDDFYVLINNDDFSANSRNVDLEVIGIGEVDNIVISNNPDMSDETTINVNDISDKEEDGDNTIVHIDWDLCQGEADCSVGKKEVYVELLDDKGEEIGQDSDDIFYNGETDDYEVLINNNNETTADRKVEIELDPGDEVETVVVSNEEDFSNGSILDVSEYIAWDVCGSDTECYSGEKTVYVEYYDTDNNVVGRGSDSIYYLSEEFADVSENILPADCRGMMKQIVEESDYVINMPAEELAIKVGRQRNEYLEEKNRDKYWQILNEGFPYVANEDRIIYFVTYGTKSTVRHGEGERTGVINSYKSAFAKLPKTANEWVDVIRIANGCVPIVRNSESEIIAKGKFQEAYDRDPDVSIENDQGAVDVISYGLRPNIRNLDKERTGIKIFRVIFKKIPVLARAWDIVRSFAYSGASR